MDDSKLAKAIDAAGISGAVAMIADRSGVRYSRAFGARDHASGEPMRDDTIFQIASMTKALVSVAALRLVEQGALSLHAPASDLLPELADAKVIDGFDAGGAPILRKAARPITLHHLLTHTSGMGYEFVNADLMRARAALGGAGPGTRAAVTPVLLFDPGDKWEYGISTDWVGFLIEAATGETLGAALKRLALDPLGMVDTSFHPTPEQAERRAALYVRGEDGTIAPMPIEIGGGEAAEFQSGGGGLYSTAPDYMRFVSMLLCDGVHAGQRLVSPETMALLTQNQIGSLVAGRMDSTMPVLSLPQDVFPGMDCGWTLAFITNPETGPNGRAPGSLAWAGIANSYYWFDPVSGVAGVLMAQLLPFGDPAMQGVYAALEKLAYAKQG